MFDANLIRKMIGEEAYTSLHESSLPKIEAMTLLHIWTQSSPKKLQALAQAGDLSAMLEKQYRQGLETANETHGQHSHLTLTECLQVADLPLKL